MKKRILISETQLKKIKESNTNDFNLIDIAKELKHLDCTGEGVKSLIVNKLDGLGYKDIKITFIGYDDETNDLTYSVYTEGPLFIIKTRSIHSDKPCMEVSYVQAYTKVN